MKVEQLNRVFVFKESKKDSDSELKGLKLSDPNPNMSPEEVLEHYSAEYPSLINAIVGTGKRVGSEMQFEIESNFGAKG